MRIGNQKVVRFDYTLTDPAGAVLDTSKGGEPLTYLHGVSAIIPGLEAAMEGKEAGDAFAAVIQPGQAYGARDENLIQDVPRGRFPAEVAINPGMQFQAQTPQGMRVVTVVSVTNEAVKVDANHPLAGVVLNFDVKVVEVRDATAEELSHGHVHGAGGHSHG